ncbi:hypothetical protein P153DRAFT_340502 [Dothidotthia symphoricarpi CBS 119687]|uniref:HTH La-type RNA-binding domain-containing protein n=1 Tax=Dothidotthia symphoricarpi CBS 119687 TaxID=1392245 RepID=A0A6A6AF23_9PLEO|nr:uncharacterized protein P153DRAFT_340502 [Dothidotthia symphoricarpi CBS 119687]KAF2129544.1 hypothetical protein P153DRAFT_340502 [Dothidotthia symphoricarpi CBS 119687]
MAAAATNAMPDANRLTRDTITQIEDVVTSAPANDIATDHPDGTSIRRQVEFYFSDENLATDLHLLQCCGGRENLPVSISRICGFKKMRGYKPRSLVIAALRKSAFLQVSTDGKTIKRKVPLQGKCALDADFGDDDEIVYDPRVRKPAVYPVPLLPQKKVEYPPGTSKNMMKPHGFEDNFVEPPLRPEEAAEEDILYDPDKPFLERIEIAIQRFKQKRRMHEMFAHVFNKLMRFGGVESGVRMYQGISKNDMKDMDAEEIARALAIHSVPWDRGDEQQWVVDFVGIGAAFLSSFYPTHYGYAPHAIKNACQVLRSFYNYLLYHKVCSEYDEQLQIARKLCDTAEQELPKVYSAGLALPGDFNKSASVIFGGSQAGLYTGDKSWAADLKKDGIKLDEIGIRDEEARIKFKIGVAVVASDEQYALMESGQLKIVKDESTGLEVVAIQAPDDLVKSAYKEQSEQLKHKLGQLEPLGKLICKTWVAEDCDEWDLPKDKYPDGKPHRVSEAKQYEFWVEESVLGKCFVSMKMDARVLTLAGGMMILDEVRETMCSFFAWTPNELWMERKPKEVRWLKKGLGLDDDEEEAEVDGGRRKDRDRAGNDEFDDE